MRRAGLTASAELLVLKSQTMAVHACPGMTNNEVATRILDGYRHPSPAACSDEMYNLMQHCWAQLAFQRPTFYELIDELSALSTQDHDD